MSVTSHVTPQPKAFGSPATADEQRAMRQERLRKIHLECGVPPEALTLPLGHALWFVSVVLDVQVHAGALGFTRSLYEYASGADERDACEAVRVHLGSVAPHVKVLKASARKSTSEHPVELTFPELVRRSTQ